MQNSPPLRRFVFLGGYYPHTPQESLARFARGLARFGVTWTIETELAGLTVGESAVEWQVLASGPGWRQAVAVQLFRWDDLITADRARSWWRRLPLGIGAFADVAGSGTAIRYACTSWRYLLFFLYPFVLLAALVAAAWMLAGLVPLPVLPARLIVAGILLAGLIAALGKRLLIDHLIDDWIYAVRLIRAGDAAADARLDALARSLATATQDEIVIFGHSLGAVHGARLIERLIALQPAGPPIRFATAGSSILKVGLHPAAIRLRATLAAIAASPRLVWVDFQAHNDAMNFYKAEPMTALGLPGARAMIRPVRFSALLSPARYARIRRNFFRLHSQFISANDRRGRYDYYMLCCGPFALEDLAGSQSGAMEWIDDTGGLTPAGMAIAAAKKDGPK